MLMKILKKLAAGGLYSNKAMANELGVYVGMVEAMISQLQQMGYIVRDKMNGTSSCCAGGCDCSKEVKKSKHSCCDGNSNIEIEMWKLTDKGKVTLKKC
jgi:Mn-dependent DtxR family transcriptional regulator